MIRSSYTAKMKTAKLVSVLLCMVFCVSHAAPPGHQFPNFPFIDGFHNHQNIQTPPANYQNLGGFYNHFYGRGFPFPPYAPHPTHPHIPPVQNLCVPPPDPSAIFNVTTVNIGYPTLLIAAERNRRLDLAFFSQITTTPIPRTYVVDNTLSCPATMGRLSGFRKYNGRCWILQDLHDIDIARCTQPYCQGCSQSNTRYSRHMCWDHYERIQVWAFCEANNSPLGQIAREEIFVPKYCACKKVQCY